MSKIFLDTNVLIYGVDGRDAPKQEKSHDVLRKMKGEHHGVVSTQVMQEFYSVATRKVGMGALEAKSTLASLEQFEIVIVTPNLIHSAIDCQILNQIDFWDALIIVAAESARCEMVWTEDMNPGQIIRGVRVVNPFQDK